jgi:hypothetical protein
MVEAAGAEVAKGAAVQPLIRVSAVKFAVLGANEAPSREVKHWRHVDPALGGVAQVDRHIHVGDRAEGLGQGEGDGALAAGDGALELDDAGDLAHRGDAGAVGRVGPLVLQRQRGELIVGEREIGAVQRGEALRVGEGPVLFLDVGDAAGGDVQTAVGRVAQIDVDIDVGHRKEP